MSDKKHFGIIEQLPCGRIRQIGTTEEQQMLLQLLLSSMSQDKPMYIMPESYDLVLKSEVKKDHHAQT